MFLAVGEGFERGLQLGWSRSDYSMTVRRSVRVGLRSLMSSVSVLLYLVGTVSLAAGVNKVTLAAGERAENTGCSAVKVAYGNKGFDPLDIPQKMIAADVHLKICLRRMTCCTLETEAKLRNESRSQFDKLLADKIKATRQIFISRTNKSDVFFLALLDESEASMRNMFDKTYGQLYRNNSDIFATLYADLRHFLKSNDVTLDDELDRFFVSLLQRMFVLLNEQYVVTDSYLGCLTENMEELKPFGDAPRKLSTQLKRSFIAARSLVRGLAVGRDLILSLSKLTLSASCTDGVTKMLHCPYCHGLAQTKPCHSYCLNVIKGCLAYHAEIRHAWNDYIDALLKIATRLEGPFNIESVVEPLDVKISDAIMNFQERSDIISNRVFEGCGQPSLASRSRRHTPTRKASSKTKTVDWVFDLDPTPLDRRRPPVRTSPVSSPTSAANSNSRGTSGFDSRIPSVTSSL